MKICSICQTPKNISDFYKQSWWIDWVKKECKVCYKRKRRTEKYRIKDRDRYNNNKNRKQQCHRHAKQWVLDNPDKRKAQQKVWNFYKRKWNTRPSKCCICKSKERIHMHHEDYSFPNRVYPLCNICHSNRHAWNIVLPKDKELILDFSDKRTLININWKTVKELAKEYWIPKYLIAQRYRKWFPFKQIIFKWNLQYSFV